jgi:hypothetical protein
MCRQILIKLLNIEFYENQFAWSDLELLDANRRSKTW